MADACRMPPIANAVQDSEGPQATFKSLTQRSAQNELTVTSAQIGGIPAYGTGTYEFTSADGKYVDHGKWMAVSKKMQGKWKFQCDICNADMPVANEQGK